MPIYSFIIDLRLYFKRANLVRIKFMSTHDKVDWKEKFTELVNTAQSELKKTTQIGLKMVSASQSNARLHDTYEALGQWLKQAVASGDIKIEDPDVKNLIEVAEKLEAQLHAYEEEVQNIKKG